MSGRCQGDARTCERKRQAAQRRKHERAHYRKFPGNPVQVARAAGLRPRGKAECTWCGQSIRDHKRPGHLNPRRSWHDGRNGEPNCLGAYYCHTRGPDQLAYLLARLGPRCAGCGDISGRWGDRQAVDPDDLRARPGPYWAKAYPPDVYVAPFTRVQWTHVSLQVDHRLALALVVLIVPEADRWAYWGPRNLQLLCHACHVQKTKADVVALKAARATLDQAAG